MELNGKNIQLKAVLFDLDGTLIDSKLDITDAANAARRHFGLSVLPTEQVIPFIGLGIRHLIEGVLDSKDVSRIDEGLVATFKHYNAHLCEKTFLYESAIDLLKALQTRHILCGVVSNKPHPLTVRTLEILKISQFFKAALGDDPRYKRKPDPEPVFEVLKRLDVSPNEAVFVGDSAVDAECARNAGMPALIVAHGFGDRTSIEKTKPDLRVNSLRDLIDVLK